jgi:16S rRNA (guanine527-N7)-methyltransferase
VRNYFGASFLAVEAFAQMLAVEGETRGLLGPREYDRLWERHILNSAAVVPFLPAGAVADVGSGAGLPGVVIAAMDPSRHVYLIEPMERRVAWLQDVTGALGLGNVEVIRGRAEEVSLQVPAVTARAVASVDKLVKWCGPLVEPEGVMVFLKGRSAREEVTNARHVLRKARWSGEVHQATTLAQLDATTIVKLKRQEPGSA